MSNHTKINVRSPFYLHLTEPTVPLPTYDCSPNYAGLTGFAVNNQGVVTEPSPTVGVLVSYTSSAGDFANGKFGTVSSDTVRTITATLRIPAGFTNTSDVYFYCNATATQAGLTTTVVEPTPCAPQITLNGSIPSQSLNSGGNSVDIDLSNYFTQGAYPITNYSISNSNPTLVSTAVSGSTLTISSNAIGGSTTLYASASDSGSNTCNAVQSISVTITSLNPPTYDCTTANLDANGGSIAADGTVTNPNTTGTITGYSPTTTANNTGSDRSVTLTFDILVPAGYTNAGSTISTCSKTFTQPSVGIDPPFTCGIAGLTKQGINTNGSITKGLIANGTIASIDPSIGFNEVSVDTARNVTFNITIPSGYASAGSTIPCPKELIQPAAFDECGTNQYYLSTGKRTRGDFCDATYACSLSVFSTGSSINTLLGNKICRNGTPYNGKGLYYAVTTSSITSAAGIGVGDFKVIQIDTTGIVLSVEIHSCVSGGRGSGSIL